MPDATTTRPRRLRRFAVRAGLSIAVLAVVLVAAWIWVAPGIVAGQIVRILESQGFEHVRVEVAALSLDRLELAKLELGGDAPFHVRQVVATYGWRDLLQRRVRTIEVQGVDWQMANAELGRPLAPFDRMKRSDSQVAPDTSAMPALPFARLEVRELRIRPGENTVLPETTARASVRVDGSRWKVELDARSATHRATAVADLQARGHTANGDVRVELGDLESPAELAGTLAVTASENGRTSKLTLKSTSDFAVGWAGRRLRANETALDLTIEHSRNGLRAGVRASVGSEGAITLSGAWPEQLREATFTGSVDLDAAMSAEPDRVFAGSIRLTDAGLRKKGAWSLEGLAGSVRWPDAWPVSAPAQSLRWKRLAVGEMAAHNGLLVFRTTSGPAATVDALRWSTKDGGHVATAAFRFDPSEPTLATTIHLTRLPLQDWLDLFGKGKVTGSGRLSGRLDVRATWDPRLRVRLEGGHVSATAPGILQFAKDRETTDLLSEHVAQIAKRVAPQHEELIRKRILDSLRDFGFEKLTFDVHPREEDLSLQVQVKGKGRKVPQELDLTVNLNGFNALLDLALDLKRGLDATRDRVQERVEDANRTNDKD